MVPIIDKDFEIPEEKSEEFLNKFEETKVSEEFMEECRQSAIKTGIRSQGRIEMAENSRNERFYVGNWIKIKRPRVKTLTYVLAQVSETEFSLIGLALGKRYKDPVELRKPRDGFTFNQMTNILGTTEGELWKCKKGDLEDWEREV